MTKKSDSESEPLLIPDSIPASEPVPEASIPTPSSSYVPNIAQPRASQGPVSTRAMNQLPEGATHPTDPVAATPSRKEVLREKQKNKET